MDYTIFYKKKYFTIEEYVKSNKWNIFISVYNDSDRVKEIFNNSPANEKFWINLSEYEYLDVELPQGFPIINDDDESESEIISKLFSQFSKTELSSNICIDITGFMRPHLIFLVQYLKKIKVKKIDFLYTDPIAYKKADKTKFTISEVEHVRQVNFCEGIHNSDISNDLLIIGSGYDYKLISAVAEYKSNANKIQLFGFPSLQADMFQENLINAYKAEEEIGRKSFLDDNSTLYAPANDPFVTAQVISDFIEKENNKKPFTNIYLSPLSTKAQTLGFALYYAFESTGKPISIIFPFSNRYTRETTEGIKKIWKYTLEFV